MEEKDIKIIEEFIRSIDNDPVDIFVNNVCQGDIECLKKLLQAYKQDEKIIQEMALAIWRNDYIPCGINFEMTTNYKDVIDYFRKKCE